MAVTADITAGIKAIKIAKEDALSNDLTFQLQETKVIRILFDDIGIQQFDILSVVEYPTYYLYYVKPQNIGNNISTFPTPTLLTGSTGAGFIDASGNINLPGTGGSLISSYRLGGLYTSNNLTNFTFNSAQGTFTSIISKNPYTFPVSFTASVWTNSSTGNHTLKIGPSGSGFTTTYTSLSSSNPSDLFSLGNGSITLVAPTSGSSNTRTIQGSFNLTVDPLTAAEWGMRILSYYGASTFFLPTGSLQFNINSFVTSSTDTNGVTTVLEPYTAEDVANSDYNVVMNNAVEARPNAFYMDVDYSSNAIIAVNEEAILNGSATRAPVQYSNYTTARIVNPRYYGSKNISPNFNESWPTSSVTLEGTFSNVPAVESDGIYFAYFDWVGGTTPELINKAGFHVKYLIDSNANVYTPNLSSSYYYNLIDSFNENNNKVNVLFQTGETSGNVDNLQGVHSVIKSGAQPRAIIFSQTGSIAAQALTTMSFSNTVVSANCEINTTVAPDLPFPGTYLNILDLTTPATSGSTYTTASLTSDYIKIQSSSADVQVIPKLSISYDYTEYDFNNNGSLTFFFEKSTNGGSTWSTYYSQSYSLIHGNSYTRNITSPADSPISGSAYRVRYSFNDNGSGVPVLNVNSGNFFLSQNPPFNPQVTSSFWTTGSSSQNILTGSQFNTNIYGVTKQSTVSGSGYDAPYLQFSLQVGDEIRFSANENNRYQIIDIIEPTSTTTPLYLRLNTPIISGTNLNSFLIRRFNPNPNFVIVDALKDSDTGGGPGFLMPEYASNDLNTKFDEVIKTLTEKGLI